MDVLKLFIVSVKAGYETNVTPTSLVGKVNECPVNTAKRPLVSEELLLRTTWIYAVYMILEYIDHPILNVITATTTPTTEKVQDDEIYSTVRDIYSGIVPILLSIKQGDHTKYGDKFNPQQIVQDNAILLGLKNDDNNNVNNENQIQIAIITQTIRVLWFTLIVLEEEKFANDDTVDEEVRQRLTNDRNNEQQQQQQQPSRGFGQQLSKESKKKNGGGVIPKPPIPRGDGYN